MNTEGLELKFTKLDKRHRGYDEFSHYVTVTEPNRFGMRQYSFAGFFLLRMLCSKTYGLSCERELYLKIKHEKRTDIELNNHWAWHTDLNNSQYRIYLKSDEERAWLLLQW